MNDPSCDLVLNLLVDKVSFTTFTYLATKVRGVCYKILVIYYKY